ncbi:MAG: 23S rRNA (pseudouridine(1915)-N(3))-methyltransferase RlmH [Methylobacteriaceae bacterium]|nr:23S rRNA (pseudouridine(1915)-N(3))-methyltransferase RlmH [Methylobacteriaceae bacterium]
MRIALVSVGRMKAGPERELFGRYFSRLADSARIAGITGVEARELPESRARRPDDRRAEEAAAIRAAIPEAAILVALDERGISLTSAQWAADIGKARDAGRSAYAVAIGGPDGLDPTLRETAHKAINFGATTWPHQLVRILAAEQLYRAITILSGRPYHRA